MLILYYKFMEIRKIYKKARTVTLEQKQRLSRLAQDMETYILTNL